jgi:hypothetical protein
MHPNPVPEYNIRRESYTNQVEACHGLKFHIKTVQGGLGILFLVCLLCGLIYAIGMRVASEMWLSGVERAAFRSVDLDDTDSG